MDSRYVFPERSNVLLLLSCVQFGVAISPSIVLFHFNCILYSFVTITISSEHVTRKDFFRAFGSYLPLFSLHCFHMFVKVLRGPDSVVCRNIIISSFVGEFNALYRCLPELFTRRSWPPGGGSSTSRRGWRWRRWRGRRPWRWRRSSWPWRGTCWARPGGSCSSSWVWRGSRTGAACSSSESYRYHPVAASGAAKNENN